MAVIIHGGTTSDNLYYYTPNGSTTGDWGLVPDNITTTQTSDLFFCYADNPTAVKLTDIVARIEDRPGLPTATLGVLGVLLLETLTVVFTPKRSRSRRVSTPQCKKMGK